MLTIRQDIRTIKTGIIAHQVNCQNRMGSGVAKALFEKWPIVKTAYHEWCDGKTPEQRLATIQVLEVEPDLYVANCFSQLDYGYDGKTVYTRYDAVESCFKVLNEMNTRAYLKQIYVPHGYGCGLANGDWNVVENIMDRFCPGIIACRL